MPIVRTNKLVESPRTSLLFWRKRSRCSISTRNNAGAPGEVPQTANSFDIGNIDTDPSLEPDNVVGVGYRLQLNNTLTVVCIQHCLHKPPFCYCASLLKSRIRYIGGESSRFFLEHTWSWTERNGNALTVLVGLWQRKTTHLEWSAERKVWECGNVGRDHSVPISEAKHSRENCASTPHYRPLSSLQLTTFPHRPRLPPLWHSRNWWMHLGNLEAILKGPINNDFYY